MLVDCDRSIRMNFGAQFVIFDTTILIDKASLKNVRTENLILWLIGKGAAVYKHYTMHT